MVHVQRILQTSRRGQFMLDRRWAKIWLKIHHAAPSGLGLPKKLKADQTIAVSCRLRQLWLITKHTLTLFSPKYVSHV
jgi:hypothetical protein